MMGEVFYKLNDIIILYFVWFEIKFGLMFVIFDDDSLLFLEFVD